MPRKTRFAPTPDEQGLEIASACNVQEIGSWYGQKTRGHLGMNYIEISNTTIEDETPDFSLHISRLTKQQTEAVLYLLSEMRRLN